MSAVPPSTNSPLVIRPRASLRMAVSLSISLFAASALGWMMTPPRVQQLFTAPQLATLIFFVALMVGIMLAVGLSVVRVDEEGLRFRNGLRRHVVPWAQIKAFRFRDGDPWAFVLLRTELEQLPLMAVQRVDGARATAEVDALRNRLEQAYSEQATTYDDQV